MVTGSPPPLTRGGHLGASCPPAPAGSPRRSPEVSIVADRGSRGHVHAAEGGRCQPDGGVAARAVTPGACGQASAAVLRMARGTGVPVGSRQVWPGSAATVHYAEPAAGVRIARAASTRRCGWSVATSATPAWTASGGRRSAGHWGLGPDARERGQALGEAAFGYAAGESSLSGRASFGWTCPACGQSVTGRGPCEPNPQDYQGGHVGGCERPAVGVAACRGWRDEEG